MTSNYKGIRGGDPALHPVKVLKDTPCSDCGKTVSVLTAVNKAPKAICKDCHHAHSRVCIQCKKTGTKKNPVVWQRDPWEVHTHNDYTLFLICDDCRKDANVQISYDLHDDFADDDGDDWP